MLDAETLQALLPDHTRILSFEIDPADPPPEGKSSATRWHQIAVEGEWNGHWQGSFSLTKRDFEQMIQNAEASPLDIPVDYEHRSVFAMLGGDSRASGWIDELQTRKTDQGAALFARVKWTDRAADAIRSREYRYVSPSIQWKTQDRKTGVDVGVSLQSLALTNTPFLEELPEVRLNSFGQALGLTKPRGADPMEAILSQLVAVLALSSDAAPSAVLSAVEGLKVQADGLIKVRDALKLSEDATADAIVSGINALTNELASAPSADQLATLQGQVNRMQAETAITAATSEGKIVEGNRAWAQALAEKDMQAFSDWAAVAPRVVPVVPVVQVGGQGNAPTDGPTDAQIEAMATQLSSLQRDLCQQMGLTHQQYVKHNWETLRS